MGPYFFVKRSHYEFCHTPRWPNLRLRLPDKTQLMSDLTEGFKSNINHESNFDCT